ncbi:hypothetical protein Tco_1153070 [Tanacetum coccineum]
MMMPQRLTRSSIYSRSIGLASCALIADIEDKYHGPSDLAAQPSLATQDPLKDSCFISYGDQYDSIVFLTPRWFFFKMNSTDHRIKLRCFRYSEKKCHDQEKCGACLVKGHNVNMKAMLTTDDQEIYDGDASKKLQRSQQAYGDKS